MLKRDVFVLIFAVSTVLLAVLFALTSELGYGMGKLMTYASSGNYLPMSLIMASFFALSLMAIFGLTGLAAYVTVGEREKGGDEYGAVYASLMPDEKKVVDCLIRHGGSRLQRDIAKETGFSRLKTHRVVSRLRQRNLVTVTPQGKTNLVRLSARFSGGGRSEGEGEDAGRKY